MRETVADLARCLVCGRALGGRPECPACGRPYRNVDGIVEAIGPLTGTNRIAAAFYDGPSWQRFARFETLFLALQGPGRARARRQVLRHLPEGPKGRILEVGIGDGQNVPLLPGSWDVYGVDLARNRLRACLRRVPVLRDRLAWAEAEALPFLDGTFDAVISVGGINYFRDVPAALREMVRVARPGASLVVADENPDLYRFGLGHILGLDGLDRWTLGLSGLDPDFLTMVFETPAAVEPAARQVWPGHRRVPIWNRLGYCLVHVLER